MGGDRDAPAAAVLSAASVATTAIVVLSGLDSSASAAARRRRSGRPAVAAAPNSSIRSAIHGSPVAGSATSPAEFTTTIAPTVTPMSSSVDRRRSDTALEHAGARAHPGADRADGHLDARRLGRGVAELGRRPALPAADRQIEDHRAGHDRHHAAVHRHAAVVFLQPAHDAVGGRQTVGAAAGEHHGVDVAHGVGRVEQIGLAGAGRPAAAIDGARRFPAGSARRWSPQAQPAPSVASGSSRWWWPTQDAADVGDARSSGLFFTQAVITGLPISPRTRYSCSTVSHWYTSRCPAIGWSAGSWSGPSGPISSMVPSASRTSLTAATQAFASSSVSSNLPAVLRAGCPATAVPHDVWRR